MNRDTIFRTSDVRTEAVEVPEWNTTVHVRTFSGAERSKLLKLWREAEKKGTESELETHIVVIAACEPNGQRLFADTDFDALSQKSATAISRVAMAALALNGLGADSVEQAKNS